MVISFMLGPPSEDQEQVENNAMKAEENLDPPKKGYSPRGIAKVGREA